MTNRLNLALVLAVTYDANGWNPQTLCNELGNVARNAANRGGLTGETDAVVEAWHSQVVILPGSTPTRDFAGAIGDAEDTLRKIRAEDLDGSEPAVGELVEQLGAMRLTLSALPAVPGAGQAQPTEDAKERATDFARDWLLRRVEDGELSIEELVDRALRYGLQTPADFVAEMLDRAEQEQAEQDDASEDVEADVDG